MSGWTALEVPQPAGHIRPGGPQDLSSDGNIILYDEQMRIEYDFWQVTTALNSSGQTLGGGQVGDTVLRAGNVTGYRTDGPGVRNSRVDPMNSARATGLPYLGGLLLPEDLARGVESKIEHALIFVLPRLRFFPNPTAGTPPNWVFPASATETISSIADPDALAAGQRIALNDGVLFGRGDIKEGMSAVLADNRLPPIVKIFLEALYKYGAYLVDGGGGFGLAAEDIHTANYADIIGDDADDVVKAMTGLDSLPPNLTHWEIMIDALNAHLSGKMPDRTSASPLLEGSGLAFGWKRGNEIRLNFTVVEDY